MKRSCPAVVSRNACSALLALLLPIVLSCLMQASNQAGLWRYDRIEILQGQWWRLWSGHLIHLNWAHLWLNLGAWMLLWLYARNTVSLRLWAAGFALCATTASLCMLWWHPQISWYVGLSGVLHGLAVIIAVRLWLVRHDHTAVLLLLGLSLKLVWEQLSGALPSSTDLIAGRVVTEAHLYGAVGGLLALPLCRDKRSRGSS